MDPDRPRRDFGGDRRGGDSRGPRRDFGGSNSRRRF
jgi:hypothetical protein